LRVLLRHPLAVAIACILVGVLGMAALRELPVDLFPRLDYPLINVITHYPAGTAEDMEQLVTRPIENAMLGLTNLQRVRSVSAPGFSQVTVEFVWGIDVLQARQTVASRLAQARGDLPAGVAPELENIGTSLAMLSTYALSGGDPVALRSWSQFELAPRLAALPGIARVAVMGGAEPAWRVDVDPRALKRASLTLPAVADAIRAAHILDTGGFLESHGRDLLVRTEGRLLTTTALEQVIVGYAPDGRPLRLTDVARVYNGARPQRYVIASDRLPAVAFTIQKQPGASTVEVSRAVDAALAGLPLPRGVRLEKFYDQAEIIGLAYRNMRDNLLAGAILAILSVVWVLGRNRASGIVALTFPLAVLGTFAVMHGIGLGLNLMTLAAITIAIGLIDDDAVVVLENIDRHRGPGVAPALASRRGTLEILGADVAGTFTVLAAFAPLVLVGGLAGRLFRPFGLTFSILLLFSLLLSLTLIPVASAHWLNPTAASPQRRPMGARWVAWASGWNLRLLDRLLRHPARTVAAAASVLALTVALVALLPARLLPLLDESSLLLSYQLAPGTSLAESNRAGDRLEAQALALPEVERVFRRTGSPESSFYVEGPDEGELVLRLSPVGAANPLAARSRLQTLLDHSPGVIGRVNEPTSEKLDESFSGLPALFGIALYGTDLEALHAAANRVEDAASAVRGLSHVVNNNKIPVDEVRVALDRSALARLRVRATEAAETVRIALQGESVSQVVIDQRPVDVFVRYGADARDTLEDLRRLEVPARNGDRVPLAQVARIETLPSYPAIEHRYGVRALTLTAEIDGNPWSVLRRLESALSDASLPDGIQWAYTGEYGQLLATGRQLAWAFAAAALLAYGIIVLQLGNLLDPLVVLAKLPLDFMGASIALFVTRQPLDLTVALGFLTLIGVSTNNGIMLLTFTRNFRREGLDARAAVRAAVQTRTRPMLMTHLSTLLALVPAAIGFQHGPQLLRPLGIMLFGGLTAGTLLTLSLLPVIYIATERWRRRPLGHDSLAAASD